MHGTHGKDTMLSGDNALIIVIRYNEMKNKKKFIKLLKEGSIHQ